MTSVYLNYPNKRFAIHPGKSVEPLQKSGKANQRIIRLKIENLSEYLGKYNNGDYKFDATQAYNDMWLELSFKDLKFEQAVAIYILSLLGTHYKPFRETTPTIH